MNEHYKIIVSGYNCFDRVEACLGSIASQTYTDYEVCVVDDASTDARQPALIRELCSRRGWEYIMHDVNTGALRGQHEAILNLFPEDDDVIVWLDLDDAFSGPGSLGTLDRHYSPNVMLTYGNYDTVPYSSTCHTPKPYPRECVKANDYRSAYQWGLHFGHMRTVRYSIYKHINPTVDFQFPGGEWFKAAGDTAVMIPALELAGGKYKCIEDILYRYTSDNPISDWRKDSPGIERVHTRIFTQITKKEPLCFIGLD